MLGKLIDLRPRIESKESMVTSQLDHLLEINGKEKYLKRKIKKIGVERGFNESEFAYGLSVLKLLMKQRRCRKSD